jgi:F-type H+-transporting ATPase subunit delta
VATGASARRYAQAVFQIALEKNEIAKWRSELETVAATLGDPQLRALLEDPKLSFQKKKDLTGKCLPGLSPLALNLCYLLVSKQALAVVEQIRDEFNRMADAHEGLEHATVTTAVALDDQDKVRLSQHLATLTGKRVSVDTQVDPDIIGGFVARIGDKLLDGSTRARLEALKKRLVESA